TDFCSTKCRTIHPTWCMLGILKAIRYDSAELLLTHNRYDLFCKVKYRTHIAFQHFIPFMILIIHEFLFFKHKGSSIIDQIINTAKPLDRLTDNFCNGILIGDVALYKLKSVSILFPFGL